MITELSFMAPGCLPMVSCLPLRWSPSFDPDTFCTSASNHEAYTWLSQDRSTWPGRHMWLSGPQGCGKTHLASIWACQNHAQWWTPSSLIHDDLGPCAVMDWGEVHSDKVDPSILYGLLNQAQTMGTWCLWVSRQTPGQWTSPRADVVSRIRAMMHVSIGPADDALLRHVLHKMLQDDGWKWPERWMTLVLRRMVRSCQGITLLMHYLRGHAAKGFSVTTDHDVLTAIDWVQHTIQTVESDSANVTTASLSDLTLG